MIDVDLMRSDKNFIYSIWLLLILHTASLSGSPDVRRHATVNFPVS